MEIINYPLPTHHQMRKSRPREGKRLPNITQQVCDGREPLTVLRLGSGVCILSGSGGEGGVGRMEGRVPLGMEGCPGENPGTEITELGL